MPKKCCVPGCKSNYDSTIKSEGAKSIFLFPRDEELRKKWLQAIPRNYWVPSKHTVVCELHFNSHEIKKVEKCLLPDGTVKMMPSTPRLKTNAIPSIFTKLTKTKSDGCGKREVASARKWAIACGRDDLLEKDNLYTSYRVCGAHFENRMFLNDLRNRLHQIVTPTLFHRLEGSSSSHQGQSAEETGQGPLSSMASRTPNCARKVARDAQQIAKCEAVCKLCRQITNVANSKIIDAHGRNAISVVLLQQNPEDGDEKAMCNECWDNLFAAFHFKGMCRDTEELLRPYISSGGDRTLDLKEIYLKEKSDGRLSRLTEEENVCRLCLHLGTSDFISLVDVQPDTIGTCILEINFRATSNPVICEACFKSLVRHSIFVRACLDAEERVKCVDGSGGIQIKTEEIEIKSEPGCGDG